MENKPKIILDLCGGTGSWAKPWRDAGFNVITITLPDYDVTNVELFDDFIEFPSLTDKKTISVYRPDVYGILAAPPCTMFSFARTNAKTPRDLKQGMACVRSCLDIIWVCMEVTQDTNKKTVPMKFWALENPYFGLLPKFLGKPAFTFEPWEFGDLYQKKTALWGHFNKPKTVLEERDGKLYSLSPKMVNIDKATIKFDLLKSKNIHPEHFGKFDRQTRRSITPQGFAKAFFEANL